MSSSKQVCLGLYGTYIKTPTSMMFYSMGSHPVTVWYVSYLAVLYIHWLWENTL